MENNLIKNIIRETLSDFDWMKEIPTKDSYRYFEIYICYDALYDDQTGDDECLEGHSFFVKIPSHITSKLWDKDIDYIAGPQDEGYDVIDWCVKNGLLETHYDYIEFVTEISEYYYCLYWGSQEGEEFCTKTI